MFLLVCFIFVVVFLYVIKAKFSKAKLLFREHVLVTGGSSGIGKALAIEAARNGASVTLLARNEENLEKAKKEVQKYVVNHMKQKVNSFSVDIAHNYEEVEKVVKQAEEAAGPITFLVNCAGTSMSSRFEETPITEFKRMLDINYLGSVYVTRAVLPSMKEQKKGRVVFVSSIAGVFGMFGYTAYSGSKFAVVGLAEALHMEVKPYNISVTVSFPPDTDTPGFAEEQKSKPIETQKLSESGGLHSAREVARCIFRDALAEKFMSYVGVEGWFVCSLCCGMTPVSTLIELISQVCLLGFFRMIGAVFLTSCSRTVRQCAKERENAKKSE